MFGFANTDSRLPLRGLNHISRVCKNVQASIVFYRDILGFVEIRRPSCFDFEGSWLYAYGVGIHLIQGQPDPRSEEINTKADHLSFQSDSLTDVEERLNKLGIKWKQATVVEGGIKISQLFFHDPDNNMVEICNCDCLPIQPLLKPTCAVAKQHSLPIKRTASKSLLPLQPAASMLPAANMIPSPRSVSSQPVRTAQ